MGRQRKDTGDIEGVDNPVLRRIYNDSKIFISITGGDGKLKPDSTFSPVSDEQLELESTITSEDIELAFAELEDNPLLQGLFNASIED